MKEKWYVWYNETTGEGGYRCCEWKEIEPISRTNVKKVSSEEEAIDTLRCWKKIVDVWTTKKCVEEDRHGYPYCKTHDCGADWPCGEKECPHCKGVV